MHVGASIATTWAAVAWPRRKKGAVLPSAKCAVVPARVSLQLVVMVMAALPRQSNAAAVFFMLRFRQATPQAVAAALGCAVGILTVTLVSWAHESRRNSNCSRRRVGAVLRIVLDSGAILLEALTLAARWKANCVVCGQIWKQTLVVMTGGLKPPTSFAVVCWTHLTQQGEHLDLCVVECQSAVQTEWTLAKLRETTMPQLSSHHGHRFLARDYL